MAKRDRLPLPTAFRRQFRADFVAIARRRATSFAPIAKRFGIAATTANGRVSVAENGRGHEAGLMGSMSKVAPAYENASMESFFDSMQVELLERRHWVNRADLGQTVFE
ncbi:MAG: hypothetical protein ACRCSX_17880 [Allorhizobium sp.]